MDATFPTSAAEAVATGAQLLDEKYPGWWKMIDLEMLQLSSCSLCVCGQLAHAYLGADEYDDERDSDGADAYIMFFEEKLGVVSDQFVGFNERSGSWTFLELEEEWRKVIGARIEADALPAVVEEAVLVA